MAKFSTLSPTRAILMLSFMISAIAQSQNEQIWQPGQQQQQQQTPEDMGASRIYWKPMGRQAGQEQQQQQAPGGMGASGTIWQPGQQQGQQSMQQPPVQQQQQYHQYQPNQQQQYQPSQQQQQYGQWQPGQQQQPLQQQPMQQQPWQPGQQQQQQQQPWQPGMQQPGQQQPWQPGQPTQQQPPQQPPQQQQPWQPGQQQPGQQQPWQPGQQQPGQQQPVQQPGQQQPGMQQPGTQQPGNMYPGVEPVNSNNPVHTLPGVYNPNANSQNTALCPINDYQTYSATDGSYFMIRCGLYHSTEILDTVLADSLQQCIERCATKDGCNAVNFDTQNGRTCSLLGQGGLGPKAMSSTVHHYAFMVDPPTKEAANDMTVMCSTECPYANHNTYNTIFGTAFRIVCGRRHATPHILSEGQGSFKDCMDACAGTNGCDSVDYHERSKTCYYSNHKGYPPVEATGYSSAWSVGCAGACGGNSCGANLAPGQYPKLPVKQGPLKPDTSCGNIGLQHYATPNTDVNGNKVTNIDLFDPAVLKRRNPMTAGQSQDNPAQNCYGTTTKVGFSQAQTNPIDVYGYKQDFGTYADVLAINHRGYIFAPQDGKYTFSLPSSDDITFLWVGQTAYTGWTRQNANIIQKFAGGNSKPTSTQIDLKKGTYTPIRIVWANQGGAGNFKLRITAPDGSVLLDEKSENNEYIVQYSCDNTSGPKYPAWGFEA
ncbi:hypothetical protein H072_10119 [Dactylellina haptotyla CBS 200.50]|uniref:PA14 domain-containing protein n=1 Tax=Dactylellina haptotyla (strain CBS 200.50) TaxID=1284197 RepID=S8BMH2_DACHA|nr:hypothetical protein H072_10119 [Dactylellina haptotyla CBS 200.50]